jgi:hypothetical protein
MLSGAPFEAAEHNIYIWENIELRSTRGTAAWTEICTLLLLMNRFNQTHPEVV